MNLTVSTLEDSKVPIREEIRRRQIASTFGALVTVCDTMPPGSAVLISPPLPDVPPETIEEMARDRRVVVITGLRDA